jgi:hypothetical protein
MIANDQELRKNQVRACVIPNAGSPEINLKRPALMAFNAAFRLGASWMPHTCGVIDSHDIQSFTMRIATLFCYFFLSPVEIFQG